jgi:hypothetical protein
VCECVCVFVCVQHTGSAFGVLCYTARHFKFLHSVEKQKLDIAW